MLDNLISLADLITRQKTHKIEIIDETVNPTTKIGRLYEMVSKSPDLSDEEVSSQLGYKGPKDKNYQNLKSALYNRMLNSIFFIDFPFHKNADQIKAAKKCYSNYSKIRFLIAIRKRDLAIELAKKTIAISKNWEFTDLNFLLCGILSTHYSTLDLDRKKYKKYRELRKMFAGLIEAELKVEELLTEFNFQQTYSISKITKNEIKYFQSNIMILENKVKKYKSRLLIAMFASLKSNFYLEIGDYKKVIDTCSYALNKIKDQKKLTFSIYAALTTRMALANFLIENYHKANKLCIDLLDQSTPTHINWYNTQHLRFSFSIIMGNYNNSLSILTQAINQYYFLKTHPLLIQLFKIKEAYIHFLVELGKIDPTESDEKPLRKFRLNRFLNDVPTYSKDKRGVNISILIIQMLLLVQNKKHGQIIDKLDALNMYSHRYLRSDNTFRSNCFIKMLTKLPDADYHPIRWQRYVEKYRKRLDEHPFELSYHNLDLEVIPFETLYDLVVEMLEKQKGLVRS